LEGDLSPSQMTKDRVLQWKPFEPKRNVLYSYRGALATATNVFALLIALVFGGVASMQDSWQMTRATMLKTGIRATAVCLVIALVVYWWLPKTEIVTEVMRI
jgi:hypothetical protein